ncbi:MAG TPA: hypothetical protein VMZ33_07035, partial [Candidatus Limnocylindrales bacterium]|nr:hypothetical protein [Candidatus Limnocylindrales bacterium]
NERTSLTLTSSTTSIPVGSGVQFTARLKIASDEDYPNLAGRALTERRVVLQRRALGATSWSNFTDLTSVADGTGRYVKTLTLTSTWDYRALFTAPSDEGLGGSSSSVSRISVTTNDEYDCRPAGALWYRPLYEIC